MANARDIDLGDIKLLKKSRLLDRVENISGPLVHFDYVNEDDEQYDSVRVVIDRMIWEEFGEPEQITVTLEPGDKLND